MTWTAGRVPADRVLGGVRAVLPRAVVDDAQVAMLAAGIGRVTSGAAAAAGLSVRGRLTPGLRADLALVDDSASWPVARATFRGCPPVNQVTRPAYPPGPAP